MRNHTASAELDGLHVAASSIEFGIRGATVPAINFQPDAAIVAKAGQELSLSIVASGTGPLDYKWIHDGRQIDGAEGANLEIASVSAADIGHYRALVHNREGTTLSRDILVEFAR
jgi:hypothetical protein